MARKPNRRASIPSLPTISGPKKFGSGAYDAELLRDTSDSNNGQGGRASRSPILSKAVQDQEIRQRSPEADDAISRARDGDDSYLLPYQPTPSINPPRPRTLAAGYDRDTETLRIRFRDGTPWEYYNVPPRVWRNFKRVKSPGRFVNRTLNQYPYARGDF